MSHPGFAIVIFAYMAGLIFVSYLFSKRTTTLSEYYVIGRSAGWPVFTCTLCATWVSMWTLMGGPGCVWDGWGPFTIQAFYIGSAAGVIFCCFVISPALRRAEYMTVPDFFGDRFASNRVRGASVLALVVGVYFYVVQQVVGGGIMFEQLFGIPYIWSMLLFLAVVLICLLFSGMWSIVVTDVSGFIFFMIAGIVFPAIIIKMAGGAEAAILYASETYGSAYWTLLGHSGMTPMAQLGNVLSWFIILGASPHLIARSFIVKDVKEIYKGGIATLICGMVMTFILFMGYVALVKIVPQGAFKTDYVAVHTALNIMPAVLGCIYLIGAFCAGTTSANAQYLTCAQGLARDLYQKLIKPNATDKEVIHMTWVALIMVGILTAILSAIRPWLLVMAGTVTGMILSFGYFPVLVLGLFWKRCTAKGAETALWLSVPLSVFVVWTWTSYKWFNPHPTIWGVILGTLICVAVSLATQKTADEEKAMERLKPIFFPKQPTLLVRKGDYRFAGISSVLLVLLVVGIMGFYQGWWY